MHLIWYNSSTNEYEYGDSEAFRNLEDKKGSGQYVTVLMELSGYDHILARKIINELNTTKDQMVRA